MGLARPARDQRRQCAAVPVIGSGANMRVVLVTTRRSRRWVVPKGWIEPGEEPHSSAAREAFEEAGLAGEVDPVQIGAYAYAKRKQDGALLPCEVLVFRYNVSRLLQDWPERHQRARRLYTPQAAAALVMEPELSRLLRGLAQG